ncbi:SPI-2 type III secretion system effector PipB [Salmonella enterica]|nr:SPI-2 type III secretion system effector PipB [Salmonella enterica]EKO0997460.1 SPI-2 type III secretion system effector PipB [Salmonella enterica subsp. enterica]ELS3677334.1 SPI-2 type III secretion system effector PipB [Salmonella enterica]ELS3679964.1 SPI-2 type III secretion system effector PipB [Salmonella enterica]
MPITNTSPENILKYLHAAGTGTKEAMKNSTSPRGILEWLVNFFTCGGVRRSNERCFQEVVEKLTSALLHVNKDAFYRGTKIFMEDINGCTTCLSCVTVPEYENKAPMVTIEVSKDGKTIASEVDGDTFWNVCQMLKLIRKYNIQQEDSLLTEEGKLNLRGVYLAYKDLRNENFENIDASSTDFYGSNLSGVNFSGANLHGATMAYTSLVSANMANTDMSGANLTNADMTNANIFCADLTDAVLCNAKLTGVNLKDAKAVSGNRLPEAGLSDVQHRLDTQDNTNETPPSLLPISDWL